MKTMTEFEGYWQQYGECTKADPELFFDNSKDGIEEAKSFCVKCLVQNQCLEYALRTNQDSGTWGNMSEAERKALKRRAADNKRRS